MVTFPGILSPVTEISTQKYGIPIDDNVSREIEGVCNKVKELINPLTLIHTRKQLETELNYRAQEYLHLKNNLWSLITSKLDEAQIIPTIRQTYHDISNLIKREDTVLSPEEQKLMLDLIDNLSDLFETFAEGFHTGRPGVMDLLLEFSAPLQRVDMCTFAIILVLLDEIEQWDMAAVKLLCRTAYEYILQVEDILLTNDRELAERLKGSSETVSLEEVKRTIGLSS